MNEPNQDQGLFALWFNEEKPTADRAIDAIIFLKERFAQRDTIWQSLLQTVRSHYFSDEGVAHLCEMLGYDDAARALRDFMPQDKKSRSGELAEALATEYANEQLPIRVPLKRLRYKDGREMALRGDDLLGLRLEEGGLHILKGEVKSRVSLSTQVLIEAEEKLLENSGYPSQHSMGFIAARLLSTDADLAKAILLVNLRKIEPRTLRHLFFTLTQSKPVRIFPDFSTRQYPAGIQRLLVAVIIEQHKDTIARIYDEAATADALQQSGDQV